MGTSEVQLIKGKMWHFIHVDSMFPEEMVD